MGSEMCIRDRPREASMLQPHDPGHFERVLRQRVEHAALLATRLLDDEALTA